MATLKITVDYTSGAFSYELSYVDGSSNTWEATLADEGTVAFVNNGQYTLRRSTDPAQSETFTFDTVSVVLGDSLTGMSSQQCGSSSSFDLSSIVFPTIGPNGAPVSTPYQWCQEIPEDGVRPNAPQFVDPKLGLSNTTGNLGTTPPSFGSCSCSSGSGGA